MKVSEHREMVNKVLGMIAAEHQADASELLTKLTEDYAEVSANNEGFQSEITGLKENNEKLRAVNAELFLKVGTPHKQEDKNNPNMKQDEKPIPFSDLFNEKGELK